MSEKRIAVDLNIEGRQVRLFEGTIGPLPESRWGPEHTKEEHANAIGQVVAHLIKLHVVLELETFQPKAAKL